MSTENPNNTIDSSGVLLRDMTVGGVTYTKGMNNAQRGQALAAAMSAKAYSPTHNGNGPPNTYQTQETQQRLTAGDAVAPDHAALNETYKASIGVLEQQKSKLPESQYQARRSELKREYERQLNGVFAAHMQAMKAPPPSAL